MTGSDKILTVSYGAFACKLEGFDDSVAVMRLVAEYFRDLANDDQLFGATPQIPDLRRLEEIAVEQTKQFVSADMNDGRLTLRATDSMDARETPETGSDVDRSTSGVRSPGLAAVFKRIKAKVLGESIATGDGPGHVGTDGAQEPETNMPEPVDEFESGLLFLRQASASIETAPEQSEVTSVPTEGLASQEENLTEAGVLRVGEAGLPEVDDDASDLTKLFAQSVTITSDVPDQTESNEQSGQCSEEEDHQSEQEADEIWNEVLKSVQDTTQPDEENELADTAIEIDQTEIAPSGPASDTDTQENGDGEADVKIANVLGGIVQTSTPILKTSIGGLESSSQGESVPNSTEDEGIETREISRGISALEVDEGNDTHVSRLLDEANSKLAGTDSMRRRSAIEHLKAAFKVTKAEVPEEQDETGDTGQHYRDDLSQISNSESLRPSSSDVASISETAGVKEAGTPLLKVKPRRPVTSGTHERPQLDTEGVVSAKPTPLLLAGEQRVQNLKPADTEIDESVPERVIPIQPKRISPRRVDGPGTRGRRTQVAAVNSKATNTVAPGIRVSNVPTSESLRAEGGFSTFITDRGAKCTEDMLECAAAYLLESENQEGFAHPQLMQMVRDLPSQASLRREDSLRAFGRLLRSGVFRKKGRGLFALSEASRIVADIEEKAV